jgi:hypothetical protein
MRLRVILAFLVAPGVPGALLYLLGRFKGYGDAAIVGPFLLSPFAYAAALVIGLPVYLVLRRKGMRSLAAYLLSGAAIGLLVAVLLFGTQALLSWSSAHEHAVALLMNSPGSVVVAVGYAVVASGFFWLIGVRESSQPDGSLR